MSLEIRKAEPGDIEKILELEKIIEPLSPASSDMIKSRLEMFNEGFLVAVMDDDVVGYVESVIWKEKDFDTFSQICEFSEHFELNGDSLYIIFIAVAENQRRTGIASMLIAKVFEIAKEFKLDRVCLVGKGECISFYEKLNFTRKKDLPCFLPGQELVPCYMQCLVNDFKTPPYLPVDSNKPEKKFETVL